MNNMSIKKATFINCIARYSNIFIQLMITSILARILTPDDFGIVAVISVFINFFSLISEMGIGPAIIQNKNLNNKEISDIFIFTFFTAIVITVGFILFSYPISFFYRNQVYISLGKILSISIFFNILNIVPNALLLKGKQFKLLGITTIIVTIVSGIITIILGINGSKYFALVINSVVNGFLMFIVNFYSSKIKIFFSFDKKSLLKIKEFSIFQFGFNFINYFSRNSDNLLIGKFLGSAPLGYYDKAYKLMLYPVLNLTHVITPVLHPILAEYQDQKDVIYNQYIKVVKLLSLLGVFISVFCFFSSEEIISIMYGNQWVQAIPTFRILSLSIWIQMISSTTGTIFQATGKTKKLFNTGVISTILTVSAIILGLQLGKIEYVSAGVVIGYILNFFIAFYILIKKVFNRSMIEFYKIFISSIFIAIIMIFIYMLNPIRINSIFWTGTFKLVLGITSYSIGLIITKEFQYIRDMLFKKDIQINNNLSIKI